MYSIHATKCQEFSLESAHNLMLIVMMISLSIRQPWQTVKNNLTDVMINGLNSTALNWKAKLNTYNYMLTNKSVLHGRLLAIKNSSKSDDDKAVTAIQMFMKIPGLNIAKAGFAVQLTLGLAGCMDSHNIKIYGLNPREFEIDKRSKCDKTKLVKITKYVKLCHDIGTENLWNTWCNYLATKHKYFTSGMHVSLCHIAWLKRVKEIKNA